MEDLKRCTKCGEWKKPEAFNKMASAKDGLRPNCRRCDHIRDGIGDTSACADLYVPMREKKLKALGVALANHGVSSFKELSLITPLNVRFFRKVEKKENGCWEWQGGKNKLGYGFFPIGNGKHTMAHRWSYIYHKGEIPFGLVLDHLCRNPSCVNPDHLEPVTSKENILRGIAPNVLLHHLNECKQGHPLEGDNIYWRKNGTRECRTCRIGRTRKSDERRKAG